MIVTEFQQSFQLAKIVTNQQQMSKFRLQSPESLHKGLELIQNLHITSQSRCYLPLNSHSSSLLVFNHHKSSFQPQNGLKTRLKCAEFITNRLNLLSMSLNRRRNVPNSSQTMTNTLPTRK